MKILVVANEGATLGLAQRLAREGHAVKVFPVDFPINHTGSQIYEITTNLWKSIEECKFIVADIGWERLYKRAEMYNKPIIGVNSLTDLINKDSVKEYVLGNKLGVKYPETEVFDDHAALQPKILSGKYRRYYVKVKRKTFVCTAPEWLAWAMYQLPVGEKVLLQEEVKGNDISIIGWFNGLSWVGPFFFSTPMAKDARAVAMLAAKKKSELLRLTIYPFMYWLKKVDYKGPITVNVVIHGKDFWVKNIKIGFDGPATYAIFEGLQNLDVADFLNQIAFSSGDFEVGADYLVGVEVCNRDSDMYGAPILGIEDGNISKIFLHGAYFAEDGYLMSGETDSIYTAVAHGRDLKEATNRVYRTIDQVQFPRMYFVNNLQGISSMAFENLKSCGAL